MKVSALKLLRASLLAVAGTVVSMSPFAHADTFEEGESGFKTERCVEPDDIMLRDHMRFLTHQRNETVLKGIRTSKFSLKGCVDCHEKWDAKGQPMTAKNPEHFCVSCHTKVAVSINCFGCHRSTPDEAATIELKRIGYEQQLKTQGEIK